MNRKLQLKYCSVCQNRSFDPNFGITCKLTGKPADFLDTCAHYQQDEEKLQEQKEAAITTATNEERMATLPLEVKNHLKQHQNFGFAVLGGLLAAIITAVAWAVISVAASYQIGWMAIGIGFLVGIAVRFFGAGIDQKFGFLGFGLAVLACLLGNLLTQVGFFANDEGTPYIEVLGYLTPLLSVEILVESFEPIDLLFLGLAGFAAYKYSFRIIPLSLEHNKSYVPEYAKLRLPLAGISAVLIGVCLFLVSSQSEIEKIYYYESGDMLSKGMLLRGVMDGEWEYYYEGGGLGSRGVYSNGLEEGVWEYFDESGGLSSTQEYHRGLLHGSTIAYYDDDLVYQQGTYQYGRMHGEWTTFYESKAISNKGSYTIDLPDGAWEYYHENGNLFQKGSFIKGEKTGIWKTWDEVGQLIEELDHLPNQEVAWITFRDQSGKAAVENGNGNFVSYYPNGAIASTGAIKEKKMYGEWKFYDENAKHMSTIQYTGDTGKTLFIRNKEGELMVDAGAGRYETFFESGALEEEGDYANGMRQGKWINYFEGDEKQVSEVSHFKDGLLDGSYVSYHVDGQKAATGAFQKGKYDGTWNWFLEDGTLESEVRYVEGKKTGEQLFYSEFGAVLKREVYEGGELIETILP